MADLHVRMKVTLIVAAAAAAIPLNFTVHVPAPSPIPHFSNSTRPDGATIGLDSGGFTMNGSRLFNVAGEMHFSRVPAESWLSDLQLMKAAGLTTVSTYVFWIHHEEVHGIYEWSGQRNLTAFVLAAQSAGLMVALRCGPYGHGEVRGGGLPDWVQAIPGISVRSNTSLFMSYAKEWYAALRSQLPDALWWQHGGPIITVQLDNESSNADYLIALRAVALSTGLIPPFYTVTGLEKAIPLGYAQPLSGRYAVRFWEKPSVPADVSTDYMFRGPDYAGSGYATLYCELGAGMVSAYHRRVNVDPYDMYADALVTMAAAQDLGYYMFHGGANPDGVLSTLQEREGLKTSGMWPVPVRSYDFVAPISESGSVHGQFHLLRMLHSFAGDSIWGPWLGPTGVASAATQPSSPSDSTTLRYQGRTDGAGRGVIFVNNYVRNVTMAAHSGVRFDVAMPDTSTVSVPDSSSPAVDVDSGAVFFWPVQLPMGGLLALRYATAQPLASVGNNTGTAASRVFFFALARGTGTTGEFAFNKASTITVTTCAPGHCTVDAVRDILFVRNISPSRAAAFSLFIGTDTFTFVLLKHIDAEGQWFGDVAGLRRAFLTASPAQVDATLLRFPGRDMLSVTTEAAGSPTHFSVYPPPSRIADGNGNAIPAENDGIFTSYTAQSRGPVKDVTVTLVTPASAPPMPANGPLGYADEPGADGTLSGASWASAAVWSLALTGDGVPVPDGVNLRLRVNYTGDFARLYSVPSSVTNASVSTLVSDSYWNAPKTSDQFWGVPLTRPLGRVLPPMMTLRIIALRQDAQIWLDTWPQFGSGPGGSALELNAVDLVQSEDLNFVVTA